jgi:site-specific DNA-methyltransferase (adenine-specific)
MVQLSLITDDHIKKTIITVPIDSLKISEYNPRKERSKDDITKLAERISRNGFEITRALWAERSGEGYEVFAGGTRLEAARLAMLTEVPVVLHEGLTEDDKVRLADEDNENDEYHESVGTVDVWANYAWLASLPGWTQERIAKAKGIGQSIVSKRLKLNKLPNTIKRFIHQGFLTERHLIEISEIFTSEYFSPWLTTEQAQLELAAKAAKDKAKNGAKTVRAVKKDVDQWKAFIAEADKIRKALPEDQTLYMLDQSPPLPYEWNAKAAFILELAKRNARSIVKVREAANFIRSYIQDNLEAYQLHIQSESKEAARSAMKAKREKELLDRFVLGDCLNASPPDNIKLLLLDPPYGKDYQSNRRWRTNAPEKIKNDGRKAAIELFDNAIRTTIPKLADDAHVLVFCDWQIEPTFREILERYGLKVKGSLIWVKEKHSAGDVKGAFAPSHERILHAVKGSPNVTPRIRDVIECTRTNETEHPTEKPIKLLETIIEPTTNEGDLIVDLFAGCGSSLLAAFKLNRQFWGVEIDEAYHEKGCERLLSENDKNL